MKKLLFSVLVALLFVACSKTLENTSIFAEIEPDEFKALLEKVEDAEFKEFCEEAPESVAFIKKILSEDDIKEFEGITYKDMYEYDEYDNGKRTDEELKKFNEDCYNLGKRLEEAFNF